MCAPFHIAELGLIAKARRMANSNDQDSPLQAQHFQKRRAKDSNISPPMLGGDRLAQVRCAPFNNLPNRFDLELFCISFAAHIHLSYCHFVWLKGV